jgi:hypothetical protein
MPIIVRSGDPKLLLPLGPTSRCFAVISEDEISIVNFAPDGACFETARDVIDFDSVGGLGAVAAAYCNGVIWLVSRNTERPCIGTMSAWEVCSSGALKRLRAVDTGGQALCIYTPNAPYTRYSPPLLAASSSQVLLSHPLYGIMWTCNIEHAAGSDVVRQTSRWCRWGPFDTAFIWAASAAGRAVAIVPTVIQPTMAEVGSEEDAQSSTCNILLAPPDSHAASRQHGSCGGSDGVLLHNTLMVGPVILGCVLCDDGYSCTLLLLTPHALQLLRVDCCTGGILQPRNSVPMSSPPLSLLEHSDVPQPPKIISSIPIGRVDKGAVARIVMVARLIEAAQPPSLVLIWQVIILTLPHHTPTRPPSSLPPFLSSTSIVTPCCAVRVSCLLLHCLSLLKSSPVARASVRL